MKIGIAFSGGGHYLEAMKACKQIIDDPDNTIFYISYRASNRNLLKENWYYVTHPKHGPVIKRILLFGLNFIDSFFVYFRTKPDIIISTGADVTLSIMLIAKAFGKKIIFIESGANVTKPSMTGKIAYRIADTFIIQWPELKTHYPKAIIGTTLL